MSRMRTLLAAATIATLAVLIPAAAQAGPPDRGSVTVSTNSWDWRG
jgi:ABC-type proline/glycine betaine transport system substrate-binding protein